MLRSAFLLLSFLLAPCAALLVGARPGVVAAVRPNTLHRLRMDDAPPPPPGQRFGATVDQDGKSNVWVRGSLCSDGARSMPHHAPPPLSLSILV